MCYHYNLEVLQRLQALYPSKFDGLEYPLHVNAWEHPIVPVVTNDKRNKFSAGKWGLIPTYIKDETKATEIAKMCLLSRIETVDVKPSFRDAIQQQHTCVIPAGSFYEWKLEDSSKKKKTKYEIKHADKDLMYFAGIYTDWKASEEQAPKRTFSVLMCPAKGLMAEISNEKFRMPVILGKKDIDKWLYQPLDKEWLIQTSQNQTLKAEQAQ